MERFVAKWAKKKKGHAVDFVVEMLDTTGNLVRSWSMPYAGPRATEDGTRIPLLLGERRGVWFNADWAKPKGFDGSRHELARHVFDADYAVGPVVVEHAEGMRLAMAVMLAGRCNTLAKSNRAVAGLTNLEAEVVLYWFTLCAYGRNTTAGKAALFTLLNGTRVS